MTVSWLALFLTSLFATASTSGVAGVTKEEVKEPGDVSDSKQKNSDIRVSELVKDSKEVFGGIGDPKEENNDIRVSELVGDILKEYNSVLTEDLKKVPAGDLGKALKKAIPDLQSQMNDYSQNLYLSSMSKAKKPNPMLLGFALGLKSWAEGLSKILPLLLKLENHDVHISSDDLEYESPCWYDEDDEMCYEELMLDPDLPCCNLTHVCCPEDFLFDFVFL